MTKTVTVDVRLNKEEAFDVAANADLGLNIYEAIQEAIKAVESGQTIVNNRFCDAMEGKPEFFKEGEHIVGPLVEAFKRHVDATNQRFEDMKPIKEDKDPETLKVYKKAINNELSKFRVMASRACALLIPEMKVGFSNSKKGTVVKIADKVDPKTKTVDQWLADGIALYGATEVFKATMENADIKTVLDAINQKQAA